MTAPGSKRAPRGGLLLVLEPLGWFQELARRHKVDVVYNHYERSAEHLFFDTSVAVDRAGTEEPLTFLVGSMVIDPTGKVVAKLANGPGEVCVGEIAKETVTKDRTLFPFLRDRRPEMYGLISRVPSGTGSGSIGDGR